ncbi:MAG: hypothetical protein HGA78_05975 [Nitrospirales bacterium]|nr:hypothetical protein [Nitrospirales bacterium]
MKKLCIAMGVVVAAFLAGCAGETKQLHMADTAVPAEQGGMKTVEFPKGTFWGGASKEQAGELAQIFVDSHNMAMKEMAEIKGDGKKSLANQEEIREATRKNLELSEKSQKNLESAQAALQRLEDMSRSQGTGEITLFFPVKSSSFKPGSAEHERLVRFLDTVSHESKGKKVVFVSIGSASAFGAKAVNSRLARERAEAPKGIIDKYLVNIPRSNTRRWLSNVSCIGAGRVSS